MGYNILKDRRLFIVKEMVKIKEIIYFKNLPDIGNLLFVCSLFEYNNVPIIFLCEDTSHNLYLCWCTDAMFQYCCVIVSISQEETIRLIFDKTSVNEIFKNCKSNVIIVNYFNEEFEYVLTAFENIPDEDLPYSNEFVELSRDERIRLKERIFSQKQ